MTRLLFANHASVIAGAEFILMDVASAWPGASAFLFEHGPLEQALTARGLKVNVSRWGDKKIAAMSRDASPLRLVPLAARFAAIALDLVSAVRRHDVIYANSQKAFVLAALATALTRKPLIWHLHDIIDATHFGKAQRRLQITLANRCATRVIVPSAATAEAFIAEGGKPELVTVVPNGLDVTPDPLPRAALRQELRLPEGPLVGVFSRLAAWKGQHVVLQALKTLPGVRCIIAGDALFSEQSYALSLKALVFELGLQDRVTFLGPRSDVPRLMQAVDVMVHPSIHPEPFGRTLVEAMLVGTPVIASNAGACPEILENGKAGTLVPPDDAAALAEALAAAFADPQSLADRTARAVARAKSQYGAEAMCAAISAIVETVAREARR